MKIKVQFIEDEESSVADFRKFKLGDIGYIWRYQDAFQSSNPIIVVTNNNIRLIKHYEVVTISSFKYYRLFIWKKIKKIFSNSSHIGM